VSPLDDAEAAPCVGLDVPGALFSPDGILWALVFTRPSRMPFPARDGALRQTDWGS